MPYIEQKEREKFNRFLDLLHGTREGMLIKTPGELNYLLTCITLLYLNNGAPNYQKFCEIEGVLNHIAKEIYWRLTEMYEERKVSINGDIPLMRQTLNSIRWGD